MEISLLHFMYTSSIQHLSDKLIFNTPAHPLGKVVQSLYNSLELKDSEIYCKRAKEMYSSTEPLRTGLFVFSMKDTKLLAMFDPSMLGKEKLLRNLKDIDRIR